MQVKTKGTIVEIGEVKTWESGFSKRTIRVDVGTKEYANVLEFQLKKERASLADAVGIGQQVEVTFYINGREYNERIYVDLDATKLDPLSAAPEATAPTVKGDSTAKDLPF